MRLRKHVAFETLPDPVPDPFPRRVAFAEEFEGGFAQIIVSGPITEPIIEAMQAFLERQKARLTTPPTDTGSVR
jgi:hypothetical protein